LLRDVRIHLELDAEKWDEAEKDMRANSGESWPVGIGRYAEQAARDRELATWLEDNYRALSGGHQRKLVLDDRGTFPGALMPRGELHNRGSDGRCEASGEVYPCPAGLAIYDSLREQMLASATDAVNALCTSAQDQPMANFDAREERVLEVGRRLQATWLGQLASAAGPRSPACPKCGVHSLNAVRRRRSRAL
jgi:hypothetical protein